MAPINKPQRPGAALGVEAARRKAAIGTKAVYADVPKAKKELLSQEAKVAIDKRNVARNLKD